jgi:hypothetical protein
MIGQERHVDISLSNEQCVHECPSSDKVPQFVCEPIGSGRDRVSVMQTLAESFADREARRNRTKTG